MKQIIIYLPAVILIILCLDPCQKDEQGRCGSHRLERYFRRRHAQRGRQLALEQSQQRSYDGNFDNGGLYARFWSSTMKEYYICYRSLSYDGSWVGRYHYCRKNIGYSVRCVQDGQRKWLSRKLKSIASICDIPRHSAC